MLVLRKIKLRKTSGPDRIIGDIVRYSSNQVDDFFVKFFNTLFDKGIFQDGWTESIDIPLFKRGDVNNSNNYRGIHYVTQVINLIVQLLIIDYGEVLVLIVLKCLPDGRHWRR